MQLTRKLLFRFWSRYCGPGPPGVHVRGNTRSFLSFLSGCPPSRAIPLLPFTTILVTLLTRNEGN